MGKEIPVDKEFNATISNEGQIALPAELLEFWGLKPGDQISLGRLSAGEGRVRPLRRRSIFERLDELKLPSLGRPLTQADIDDSVAEAMREKYERSKG
jgi:bifunctional DNA-binding transcriptional regulator/antitoxin component of YhaV-PrlF toxin-antitoxin module